ncbi:hypothetical protein L7F22_059745 [Adiantum nelumboides]|nr:hypothetical protein [Adiantum nelumboides]
MLLRSRQWCSDCLLLHLYVEVGCTGGSQILGQPVAGAVSTQLAPWVSGGAGSTLGRNGCKQVVQAAPRVWGGKGQLWAMRWCSQASAAQLCEGISRPSYGRGWQPGGGQSSQVREGQLCDGAAQPGSESEMCGMHAAAWFVEVAERTAALISKWQGVGFTHGVLNTDNMSVLGLTIDYGPFGFLDAFDPKFTPNTTDLPGRRYCFANQPDIGLWNLMQLATTLKEAELISEEESEIGLNRYGQKFMEEYKQLMSRKLGLKEYNRDLINKLLSNMAFDKVDYTNCFRALGNVKSSQDVSDEDLLKPIKGVLLETSKERRKAWSDWMKLYTQQLRNEGLPHDDRKASMDSVNPKYILRNYLCQSAIDAAEQGDYSEVNRLLKVMKSPYNEQPEMEKYARLPPAWAYRPGVCMLSCSS